MVDQEPKGRANKKAKELFLKGLLRQSSQGEQQAHGHLAFVHVLISGSVTRPFHPRLRDDIK